MIILYSCLALLIVVFATVGFVMYSNKVNNDREILEAKNYTDSLTNVVNTNLTRADSLTRVGMLHDEGFDAALVAAKEDYLGARDAVAKLQAKGVTSRNFDAKEAQLDTLLSRARAELDARAKESAADPDPDVRAAAESDQQRVAAIDKVLPQK